MRPYRDCIIGFDSAWTDKPGAPGAICAILVDNGGARHFVTPRMATFRQALAFIDETGAQAERCLVALDQPTIVPNASGMRPAERVAASLVSWLGGGVQPANRGKLGMFDDAAPLWPFLKALDAVEDPEGARRARSGRFLIEVFPALAVASLEAGFLGRRLGPRYNPARRKTFRMDDWTRLVAALATYGARDGIDGLAGFVAELATPSAPRKADQDRLDAALCAIIGLEWLLGPRERSIMIGDLASGYIVAPAAPQARQRLEEAAARYGVPVDGRPARPASTA